VKTSTHIPGFELRPATPEDVPLILSFIRDLAAYERLLHEVVASWNEAALKFYKSLGAQAMDQWTVYRLTGEALARLATAY
jgi:hypothetical protein